MRIARPSAENPNIGATQTLKSQGMRRDRLDEAIFAAAEKLQEAKVAQDLELLADFVTDVAVVRVEF